MCLDTVTKRLKRGRNGYGYKVFTDARDGYFFEWRNYRGSRLVPVGKWLRAVRVPLEEYTSGFHIFLSRNGAMSYANVPFEAVVRVRYRGGKTIGAQNGIRTIVAREMFVPKPRKQKAGK